MSDTIPRESLEGFGGLITLKDSDECLGDLMHFDGHGTYDPNYGRVPISKEEADRHNKVLDEARLKGMDDNCEIGQGSFAYHVKRDGRNLVTTFLGTIISERIWITGNQRKTLFFNRAGKIYRGRLSWGESAGDAFNFKRIE